MLKYSPGIFTDRTLKSKTAAFRYTNIYTHTIGGECMQLQAHKWVNRFISLLFCMSLYFMKCELYECPVYHTNTHESVLVCAAETLTYL